jgi:hypothetical protein
VIIIRRIVLIDDDQDGKIALYGSETPEYKKFSKDKSLKVLKAMKAGR